MIRRSLVLAALLASTLLALHLPSRGVASPRFKTKTVPVVIAIVEPQGMNVLHRDFSLVPGSRLSLPEAVRAAEPVRLPQRGSFAERIQTLERGPLGRPRPGTLYRILNTRIAGLYTRSNSRSFLADRRHATGVASAAVGLRHGTNPQALLVFVKDTGRAAWEWLEDQEWIDIISVSYGEIITGDDPKMTCVSAPSVRRISEQGRLVFGGIGDGEQFVALLSPTGVPEAYQVGGVDNQGRYQPLYPGSTWPVGSNRPYETGDRYDFPAADSESLTESMDFGGASGATPSTAGRAAELVAFSRQLLHSTVGFSNGKLASIGPGGTKPAQGPLKDGDLTSAELIDLMHHTATPAERPSPFRYFLEGYGAFQAEAVNLAKEVLMGEKPEPERDEEDRAHALIESARRSFFTSPRC